MLGDAGNLHILTHAIWPAKIETGHRRRIYTKEQAKVVAAVWKTEFIQFLAALAILD